jgi:hypothetical protein
MNIIKTSFLGLALSASLVAGASHAADSAQNASYFGTPSPVQSAERKIEINPDTKWVNVTNGETVTFAVGEKSFTFHFQTYIQTLSLNLADIAPGNVDVSNIRVYVANVANG